MLRARKKHEDAYQAFCDSNYELCVRLAGENYRETQDMRSYMVAQTAKYRLRAISWDEAIQTTPSPLPATVHTWISCGFVVTDNRRIPIMSIKHRVIFDLSDSVVAGMVQYAGANDLPIGDA